MATIREEIYFAVADAATKYGMEGLTIKNIAKTYGKSEALLYKYCDGKDDLMFSTYQYVYEKILKGFTEDIGNSILSNGRLNVRVSMMWKFYMTTLLKLGSLGYFYTMYTEMLDMPEPFNKIFIDAPTGFDAYDKVCWVMKEQVEKEDYDWVDVTKLISDHAVLNVVRHTKRGDAMTETDINNVVLFIQRGMVGEYHSN